MEEQRRRVVIDYRPRPQFVAYHNRNQRFARIVAHRRFGKTVGCVNELIRAALTNKRANPPPRYAYVAPTFTQAKDIAWGYVKHYSAVIPGIKISEGELYVDFPNGARLRLYGADNYDRMRGLYFDAVVIDEPAMMDPRAWPEVIRPTLSDFQGGATFIGTPRGKDWFYRIDLDEDGQPLPGWFRLTLKADETGIIAAKELESIRAALSEDQYSQEFQCSFDAAIQGAYFARLLAQAQDQGRVGQLTPDPLLPVRAYWDIGGAGAKADATAIWICQFVDQEIWVLDYLETRGQVLAHTVAELRKRGYQNAICILPHDGANTNNITGKRYADHLRDAEFDVPEPVPNQGAGAASMRIESVRRLFPRIRFNAATTAAGREALAHYHERRDEQRNIGLGPEHDWASHAADAFGLMAISYEAPEAGRVRPPIPVYNHAGGWMS